MTNQAITIIDELDSLSPAVKAAMETLANEIVKSKKEEMNSSSTSKTGAVLQVVTPRGWEIFNDTLAEGDMEGIPEVPQTWNTVEGYNNENGKTLIDVLAAITVPTSYEDVLEANVAFLTRKIELLKVILNNTETGYRKYEMSEELDKCESIEEMNEMILD